MREIKFRALIAGEMREFDFYDIYGGEFDDGYKIPVNVMQYTGLKDKKGVETYCGDIIKGRADLGGKTKRFIGVVNVNLPSVTVAGVKQYKWKVCSSICDVRCFEVIGNIYENPELLEEAK